MTNDYHITREHIISLLIVASAILLVFYFPVSSFAQGLIVIGAFAIVFPLFYIRLVLRKDFSHLALTLPTFSKRTIIATLAATLAGIAWAFFLFFIPYSAAYISETSLFMTTFKDFVFYEIFIVLPVLLFATFFGYSFIGALELPGNIAFLLTTALFGSVCIAILGLPLISIVYFFSLFSIYYFSRSLNFFLIVFTFFVSQIVLGTLIAKSLLS